MKTPTFSSPNIIITTTTIITITIITGGIIIGIIIIDCNVCDGMPAMNGMPSTQSATAYSFEERRPFDFAAPRISR